MYDRLWKFHEWLYAEENDIVILGPLSGWVYGPTGVTDGTDLVFWNRYVWPKLHTTTKKLVAKRRAQEAEATLACFGIDVKSVGINIQYQAGRKFLEPANRPDVPAFFSHRWTVHICARVGLLESRLDRTRLEEGSVALQ